MACMQTIAGVWKRLLVSVFCLGLVACVPISVGRIGKGPWHHSSQSEWKWRWHHPTPHGHNLNAVWVAPDDDAWAVGDHGTCVHYQDEDEQVIPTGTNEVLKGIWGTSDTDIWAVGRRGTILHWDGKAWTKVPSPVHDDLVAVWGASKDRIWAVGATLVGGAEFPEGGGTIVEWDGVKWSVIAREVDYAFTSVWGTSATNVYVVGYGPIWHFDGKNWSSFSLGQEHVGGIWGASENDVWVIAYGKMAHWNGNDWSLHSVNVTNADSIGGNGVDEVWVVGYPGVSTTGLREWKRAAIAEGDPTDRSFEDRPEWQDFRGQERSWFKAVGGRPGGAVWLVGFGGNVAVKYPGRELKVLRWADLVLEENVLADADGNVLVVDDTGNRIPLRTSSWWTSDSIAVESKSDDRDESLVRFHASATERLWACGYKGCALRSDGKWTRQVFSKEIDAIGSASEAEVWILRRAELHIWQGGDRWKLHAIPAMVGSIATAGTAFNDIWVVGYDDDASVLSHFDGQAFRHHDLPEKFFASAICVNDRNDAWLVGGHGQSAHWDGKVWRLVKTGVNEHLDSVWCGGRDDVWAAGEEGVVVAWNGKSWHQTPTPTNYPLYRITGNSSGVWAVGRNGIVLHFGP